MSINKVILLSIGHFFAFILASSAHASTKDFKAATIEKLKLQPTTHDVWFKNKSWLEQNKDRIISESNLDRDFCTQLLQLRPQDLMGLYGFVREDLSSCSIQIKNSVESYLNAKVSKIKSTRKKRLRVCSKATEPGKTFGPSEVYTVNSKQSSGPMVGNGFNDCRINFTFDDGPSAGYTYDLLKILSDQNVHANFFVLGQQVKKFPNQLIKTFEEGHEIGNHSDTHPQLDKLKFKDAVREIEIGFEKIHQILNFSSSFFRFPYGAFTKDLRGYLKDTATTEFFWKIDTLDWQIKDPEKLYAFVLDEIEKAKKGIILFHDVHPQTIAIMPLLFEELKEFGYYPTVIRPVTE